VKQLQEQITEKSKLEADYEALQNKFKRTNTQQNQLEDIHSEEIQVVREKLIAEVDRLTKELNRVLAEKSTIEDEKRSTLLQFEGLKMKLVAQETPDSNEPPDVTKLRQEFEQQFEQHKKRMGEELERSAQSLEKANKRNEQMEDQLAQMKRNLEESKSSQTSEIQNLQREKEETLERIKELEASLKEVQTEDEAISGAEDEEASFGTPVSAPPPPPASMPPSPVPPPVSRNDSSGSRLSLLDAIRNPTLRTLKKPEANSPGSIANPEDVGLDGSFLSILAKALVDRRNNLNEDQNEEGSGSEENVESDEEEWTV